MRQYGMAGYGLILYKRVRKLPFPDPFFGGKITESPGPLHTVFCALRCVGVMLENSVWTMLGLKQMYTVALQ